MLHHAATETVELLDHLLEILVVVLDLDLRRTTHLGIDAGHAEAALGILAFLLAFLKHYRIDHHPLEILEVVICLGQVRAVYDHEILVHTHLRSGKTASVGNLEGLPHVIEELCDALLVVEIDICILATENVRAV